MTTATPAKAAAICRHCRERPVNRPRGLCYRCFYDAGVRDLYAVAVRRGSAADQPGELRAAVTPPPVSTSARPGSPEKVAALEARAAAGFGLWHPADAQPDV